MIRAVPMTERHRSLAGATLLMVGLPFGAAAQEGRAHADHAPSSHAMAASANASMSGPIAVSPYMKLTPERPATAADSTRAAQVAAQLRRAIEKYRDVRVAEADGYEIFAPRLPQEVYHFTSRWRSIKESFRFDPTQPSSLLYRRSPEGTFELVGAMYHAPKRLSLEQLDERVPLGIARWHAHTNFCVPKRRDRERWLEMKDGKPVFGPAGGITTRAECDAVGGKFHEQVFGWMVHAMVFAGDDPRAIWGADHAAHGDHRP